MTDKAKAIPINITLPPELKAALEAEAKSRGLPLATFIKSSLTGIAKECGRLPKE